MAYPLQAQCNNLSGPWYVDMTDCIYSSLTYFNANTNYFECKIEDLIVKINKSGIRRLIAGNGIILEDISVAGNTIYKISTPQVQLTASTVILSSTSSIAYVDIEPASLIPWWTTVDGTWLTTPGTDSALFPTLTSAYYGKQSIDILSDKKFYYNSDNKGSQNFEAGWYRIRYADGGMKYDYRSSNWTGTGANVVFKSGGQTFDTYVGCRINHVSDDTLKQCIQISKDPNNVTPTRQLTFFHDGGPIYIYLKDDVGAYTDNELYSILRTPPTLELYKLKDSPTNISQHILLNETISKNLQDVVDSNSNIIPTAVSITQSKTLKTGSEGCALLQDGRVFVLGSVYPGFTYNSYIYNPLNDTVNSTPNNPFKFQQSGGIILMADGRVYIADKDAKGASIYDPSTDTWSSAAAGNPNWSLGKGFYNACLLPNGQIYNHSKYKAPHIIYDPITDTVFPCLNTSNIEGWTCVQLRDGTILKIPGGWLHDRGGSTVYHPKDVPAEIYDWRTNSITQTCPFPAGAWFSGRLTAEGIAILAPNGVNTPISYNPYTDTVTVLKQNDWFSGNAASGLNYGGGCLLPDGRLFFAPWYAREGIIYDPYTDTTTRCIKNPSDSLHGFGGITMMLDGSILLIPVNSNALILKFHNNKTFEPNLLTSPFFQNKGY